MDKRISADPLSLCYYMLESGLDGFAPRAEVAAMRGVTHSRPATFSESSEYFDLETLNPHLAVA